MSFLGPSDFKKWARLPASQSALNLARCGADKGDADLAAIVDQHVRDGVATPSGKLLRRWEHGQWVAA